MLARLLPQLSGEAFTPPERGEPGRTLVVIPRNCTGCRTCELACSFAHSSAGHLGRPRIRVHEVGPDRHVQITCLQCVSAACIQVCPTQAIVRDETTRAVVIEEARCVGCALCEAACPFGHMHFDTERKLAVKCDLCGGEPVCAAFCPYGALEMR
ncbi:MAG: 4Fe-4S dicluster domain-containing protein [Actinomycetota bacterium]